MAFSAALLAQTPFANSEFAYFLAQTKPFHETKLPQSFPISQLAYIINEDGKPELWTRDSKVLMNFVLIGNKIGFIQLDKKDKDITFKRFPGIDAVIHKEKTPDEKQ